MIGNRLRGLLNFHLATATVIVSLLLLVYQNVIVWLRLLDISSVNFMPYLFCVTGGMLLSARYLRSMAARFHCLTRFDIVRLTTRQVAAMAIVIFSFMFAFKDRSLSRIFVGTYLGLIWVTLLFVNLYLPRFFSNVFFMRGRMIPTLFIGTLSSLEQLKFWLVSKKALGMLPVGFLSESTDELRQGEAAVLPLLGCLGDLAKVIQLQNVMQLVVLTVPGDQAEMRFIIETCQETGCRLLIYNNLADQLQHPLTTVNEGGRQFYTLQEEPLEEPVSRLIKRAFDLIIALPTVVLILPPLMLLVKLVQIAQSPGSLFLTQERIGYGQKLFRIIKFRSMYAVDTQSRQACKIDDRIYPLGRFLRKTSLEEFPQFLNVLKGEMSVVGPRPHPLFLDEEFDKIMKQYRTRYFVKPGITGLAQCNGFRGEITGDNLMEKRITLDIAYVTRWSIWLDVWIVIKTAWSILFPHKSAY